MLSRRALGRSRASLKPAGLRGAEPHLGLGRTRAWRVWKSIELALPLIPSPAGLPSAVWPRTRRTRRREVPAIGRGSCLGACAGASKALREKPRSTLGKGRVLSLRPVRLPALARRRGARARRVHWPRSALRPGVPSRSRYAVGLTFGCGPAVGAWRSQPAQRGRTGADTLVGAAVEEAREDPLISLKVHTLSGRGSGRRPCRHAGRRRAGSWTPGSGCRRTPSSS
jgi:hypothetical protein